MDKKLVFCVSLKEDDRREEAIEQLRKVNINLRYFKGNTRELMFKTDKKTYEEVFKTKLEYNDSHKKKHYFSLEGYKELKKARVPEGLEGLIKSIFLKKNISFGDLPYNSPYSFLPIDFEQD